MRHWRGSANAAAGSCSIPATSTAQLHNTMLTGVSELTHVYAPLGPDVTAYMNVGRYTRENDPTHWSLLVYTGPDYLNACCASRPGTL